MVMARIRNEAVCKKKFASTAVSNNTRSQGVARIADRTAKNCRGHVI